MEAELIMMGLSSICSFLAAYTMYKIQKREKSEVDRLPVTRVLIIAY